MSDTVTPMDEHTLKALQGSIEKWRAIEAGTGTDHGDSNCPLCALFIRKDCRGCPVRAVTGRTSCIGTPYMSWLYAGTDTAFTEKHKALARAEREFLESLLP